MSIEGKFVIKLVFFFFTVVCGTNLVFATDDISKEIIKKETKKKVKVGNLALPVSQQPGPLIGFGQNIVDRGDLQFFSYINYLKGNNKKFIEIAPTMIYGIKDNLSLFVELPIAASFKLNNQASKGLEDVLIQLEYVVFDKNTETSTNQLTVVANITVPTGAVCKNPSTGLGVPSYFIGFTANHVGTQWYPFASAGAIITTSDQNTKFGNQFLYQCGISKNISYASNEWIFNWMVELTGTYKQRDTISGQINKNSGGNVILLGPSLWFSTQRVILQAGISGVIYEHLFGVQNKNSYYIAIDLGWKF